MNEKTLFPATMMPDKDWWQSLWPDPKQVLKSVGIEPTMQVVDLCCGDGHFTQPMCELVKKGKIWALDLDADLLAEAEKACKDFDNFTPILGDARELTQRIENTVDYIFIANTFHGIPDKTAFSNSAFDALSTQGQFVIINWHRRPREETTVLDQPRGPDTELRMSAQDVQIFVEPAGFKLDNVIDVGPYHYAAIFSKNN